MPLIFVFVDVLLLLLSSIEFYGHATVYVYINQMNYARFLAMQLILLLWIMGIMHLHHRVIVGMKWVNCCEAIPVVPGSFNEQLLLSRIWGIQVWKLHCSCHKVLKHRMDPAIHQDTCSDGCICHPENNGWDDYSQARVLPARVSACAATGHVMLLWET